jgi:TATA-binding protein-associated factor Taf7
LVDLPCIIEAQKTLDFNTFYKSCDASQMMYVHNKYLDHAGVRTPSEIMKFCADFNPLTEDEEFFQGLYQRRKLKQRLEEWEASGRRNPLIINDLKFRHGLSPGAYNVRNVRHKVD